MPRIVFKKKRKKTGGRVKGVPNKTTRQLREAIILGAEAVGRDGRGREGLVGYCHRLALREPKAFAALMGRVLPYQITGANGGPIQAVLGSMTPQEAANAYAESLKG